MKSCYITLILLFVFGNADSQNNISKYFSLKLKSPVYLSKINSDTITSKQKIALNYSLGFGFIIKTGKKTYFNSTISFGIEKFKSNIFPTKYPSSAKSKVSFITCDIDLKYGVSLNQNSKLFIGFSGFISKALKIKTSGQGTSDTLAFYSPDFSSNFNTKFDIRPSVSFEFKPFKSDKIKLLIGTEFSVFQKNLSFNIVSMNNNDRCDYKLKYNLIQPFICLNYYL